jgi:Mg2+-importing ATPase
MTYSLQPNFSPSGLTNEVAAEMLKKHGRNLLATERPQSPLSLFITAMANPFNFLLIVLAIISIATGDNATFAVMMCMVVAATGLRSVFFYIRARKTDNTVIGFGKI